MNSAKSDGVKGRYQTLKPITSKNIGKKMPHEKRGKKDYQKKNRNQLRTG